MTRRGRLLLLSNQRDRAADLYWYLDRQPSDVKRRIDAIADWLFKEYRIGARAASRRRSRAPR